MEFSLFMSDYEFVSKCKGLLLPPFRNVEMMFDLKFSLNGKWSLNGEWLLNALQTYLKTQFHSFMCSMTLKARKRHNGLERNVRFQMENTNSIVADAQENIETNKFIGIKRMNIFKSGKRVHSLCAKSYKNVDHTNDIHRRILNPFKTKYIAHLRWRPHSWYINIFTYIYGRIEVPA